MNVLEFEDKTQRHIGRAIAIQAQQIGDRPFILWGEERHSYAQVNQRVNELAAGLAQRGLSPGERVAFYMDSSSEVILLALAVNKLGAVWVPVNTDYKGDWLLDTIARSRPRILVTDSQHTQRVAEVWPQLDIAHLLVQGGALEGVESEDLEAVFVRGASEPEMSDFSHGDDCAVLWTSGTTGKSKGVTQSHNVFFNAVMAGAVPFGAQEDDVIYSVLPMYNTAAWVTNIFRALFCGLPLALDSSFSVSSFWQRIDYYKATQTFTLGAMHMFLFNAPEQPDDASHSLRKLMAIPMPPHVAAPFCERFNLSLMPQGLGQSEAQLLCNHNDSPDAHPPAASCGRPPANLQAMLADDEGNEVPVGEAGELWVKPLEPFIIFSGYFDDPKATAAAYEGEWYKTGDMLRKDEAGYYYFTDRKKDSVRFKGRNISTFEVELAARRHPAIQDCAAFGVPSDEMEHESELKLDVILKEGESVTALDLAQFINDNAPYFFVPRYIEFVDSLPYTPTNKVQKFKLRERGVTEATWDAKLAGFTPKGDVLDANSVNIIWVSTAPRTGSMWLFNTVREILRTAGMEVEPRTVPHSDKEMAQLAKQKAMQSCDSNKVWVLKVHKYLLKQDLPRSKIITSHRDLRDVMVSFMEFMKTDFDSARRAANGMIRLLNHYRGYDPDYLRVVAYRDIEQRPQELILELARFLDISLSDSDALAIAQRYSREKVRKIVENADFRLQKALASSSRTDPQDMVYFSDENYRAFDQQTGFQSSHVSKRSTNDWKTVLTYEQQRLVLAEHGDWLEEFGYHG